MSETLDGAAEMPLTYEDKLARYGEIQLAKARLEAEEQQLLAALAEDAPSWMSEADAKIATAKQWVREEVGAIARVSWQAAGYRIRIASALTGRLRATLAMVHDGRIWFWHARFLAEETAQLDDQATAAVQQRVLARAEGQSLTQFKAAVRRAIKTVRQAAADAEHQRALADRRVVITHGNDGMAQLWASIPSEGAEQLAQAITTRTTQIRQPEDTRTPEQLRADAFMSLANPDPGSDSPQPGPSVHITMTLATALDQADEPAELAGVGPITAEHARRIAFTAGATWRRLITDPLGRAIDLATHAYRPPPRLRRFIQTRDHTCRFPHCTRRAARCDIDHCQARANGGQTCEHNLHLLCTRHHHMKHDAGWHPTIHPDGTTTWTSPTGHHYTVPPYQHPTDPPNTTNATTPPNASGATGASSAAQAS